MQKCISYNEDMTDSSALTPARLRKRTQEGSKGYPVLLIDISSNYKLEEMEAFWNRIAAIEPDETYKREFESWDASDF